MPSVGIADSIVLEVQTQHFQGWQLFDVVSSEYLRPFTTYLSFNLISSLALRSSCSKTGPGKSWIPAFGTCNHMLHRGNIFVQLIQGFKTVQNTPTIFSEP
jgi:hypothetical protein